VDTLVSLVCGLAAPVFARPRCRPSPSSQHSRWARPFSSCGGAAARHGAWC